MPAPLLSAFWIPLGPRTCEGCWHEETQKLKLSSILQMLHMGHWPHMGHTQLSAGGEWTAAELTARPCDSAHSCPLAPRSAPHLSLEVTSQERSGDRKYLTRVLLRCQGNVAPFCSHNNSPKQVYNRPHFRDKLYTLGVGSVIGAFHFSTPWGALPPGLLPPWRKVN